MTIPSDLLDDPSSPSSDSIARLKLALTVQEAPQPILYSARSRIAAPVIELSEEQEEARTLILQWLEGSAQEFRLGGYAGTGKTTLIKALMASFGTKGVCAGVAAFTGKAVSVLRRKGVPRTSTLHALLYDSEYDSSKKKIVWIKKTILPYDLVIVDEASMVSTELYTDLTMHAIKLLFVGDPAQLEPVGDNPNLMRKCDFVLTHIHRQAKGNPILRLARSVREGNANIPVGEWRGENDNGCVKVVDTMYGIDLASYDMVICAKNLTRHGVNHRKRMLMDREGDPVVGESVICLKNDKEKGLFNGLILEITSKHREVSFAGHEAFYADMQDEADDKFYDVPVLKTFFGKDYKQQDVSRGTKGVPFDFGDCLTAWKAQGSEWDRVLFIDEPIWKTDTARLRYTGITRASKELTIVLGR